MKAFACTLVALSLCATSLAQEAATSPLGLVTSGVETLSKSNASDAIEVWLKGSPIENDAPGRSKILGGFSTIEGLYGKALAFETIQVFPITPSTTRIYGVIRYEKGPLYTKWDCYKTASGWVISDFLVHTTAEQVFPTTLLTHR